LLAACFHQVLSAGFFHGDPHPGNLMWADGRIWLLDLGMVGEVDEATRRQLLLLLLAFWQGDTAFLADVTLALAPNADLGTVDVDGFEASLGDLVASTRGASLAELEIGPLLQQITEISVRHHVPIPSSLAMVGKALAQVQSTVVTLAPDVDLFEEARRFFTRDLIRRLTGATDTESLLYEAEKLRYRVTAISDLIATAAGARPGRRLEIGFASERLERTLKRTGRTVAVGLIGGAALVAAGIAAAGRSAKR
jgi:predicted unusual protein kinase regulating ubiquinone biosynthesis (AarF/ABC1/UbiB family)